MIGEGEFGSFYKAVTQYSSKRLQVMVKHLNERYKQGHKERAKEIDYIGSVKHPNLVKLVGYCAEDDNIGPPQLLVYEYFQLGSVKSQLSSGAPLPWDTRLKVAQDAAYGLAYLHGAKDFQLIIGNFNSSNVLLDGYWNAKVFYSAVDRSCILEGLQDVSRMAIENIVREPSHHLKRNVVCMSDVWSYGVFLCELITGRCISFDQSNPNSEQKIVEWVKPCLNSRDGIHIVDSRLAGDYSLQSVTKLSKIAKCCLANNPKARPTMIKVVHMVTRIITIEAKGKGRLVDRKNGDSGCWTRLCSSKLKGSP